MDSRTRFVNWFHDDFVRAGLYGDRVDDANLTVETQPNNLYAGQRTGGLQEISLMAEDLSADAPKVMVLQTTA